MAARVSTSEVLDYYPQLVPDTILAYAAAAVDERHLPLELPA